MKDTIHNKEKKPQQQDMTILNTYIPNMNIKRGKMESPYNRLMLLILDTRG